MNLEQAAVGGCGDCRGAGGERRMARPWASFADGCRCDRDTLATIDSQMRIETVERAAWRGMPPIVKPLIWGSATP